jgi:cysteine dioxygenase
MAHINWPGLSSKEFQEMSTNVTQSNARAMHLETEQSNFSLADLMQTLRNLNEAPALEDLGAWMNELRLTPEDLRPYTSFKPKTYARHLVLRTTHAELLVLCWRPGQRTPIHDHNGSYGTVRVCEGVMWETMFALDAENKLYYQTAREWTGGGVTGADVPDIHQLGNPEVSGKDLITLHLYAPPLGVLNTYRVGSSEVGHYTPDEFMDGAGI